MNLLKFGLALALVGVVQCGNGNSVSKKVSFKINPDQPIIILSNLTLDFGTDTERVITAPWFLFTFNYANNSDKTITIQSLKLTITTTSPTGNLETTNNHLDPGLFPTPRAFILEMSPGQSGDMNESYYVHGLQESASNTYQVQVDVQGWIGTSSQPEDRFTKTVTFNTK
ncbi:MAG: hypothetical protein K1X29_07765 [Bdellovibrionales bacterium]|nr:hypothetical protein [Bdellovibrionales bacterium]